MNTLKAQYLTGRSPPVSDCVGWHKIPDDLGEELFLLAAAHGYEISIRDPEGLPPRFHNVVYSRSLNPSRMVMTKSLEEGWEILEVFAADVIPGMLNHAL